MNAWLVPSDGFDEGVDLDSLMPAVQLVLIVVALSVWQMTRRRAADRDRANHPTERIPGDRRPAEPV